MTAICCAKCQQPMPNWIGAINLQCSTVCRKCFGKILADVPVQPRVSVELEPQLLELIETENDKLKSVVCLAMQSSIQEADPQGIFSNPAGLLKKALNTLYPGSGYNYKLLQTARKLLITSEFWLPQGRQVKGRGSKQNQMRLGEKIRPFQALP